jgi:CBS domain-containing protein
MADAVGEVGNLLVGSWNRVFRGGWVGHKHFTKDTTFIGQPWDNAKEAIGLGEGQGLEMALYETTVGSYPPFSFAVLFSNDLWEPKPQPVEEKPAEAPAEQPVQAQAEPSGAPQPAEQAAAPQPEQPKEEPAVQAQAEPVPPIEIQGPSQPVVPQAEVGQSQAVAPAAYGLDGPSVAALTDRQAVGLLNAPVETVMGRDVVWASPDDSVLDVLRAMQQHDVGYAMVGRAEALEGIVSRSNVLGAISPYLRPVFAKWRRPEDDATLNIKIKWAMSRPVQTVSTGTTLGQAIERMQQFGGRCLPVTTPNGKVVGVLTVFDIFKAMSPKSLAGRTPQAPCLMA